MAERLDVAERLADGRESVEHTQTYVRACHALGYADPDLTSHPSQLSDLYDSEDGLDLRALDRDCAELRAAGSAVTEALRIQRAQVAELASAWTGPGGDNAVRFLERHCDDGAAVVTEIRAAAQRCESLRDNLWYLVDSKVATAIAVDERTRPQRQQWLAAAATVTTGAGDRAAAEEVVHRQIAPYVDEDVRHDWLTTMRSTAAGVATSYDMVIDRMAAAPAPSFEFPGELRLFARPLPSSGAPPPAAAVIPAAASGSPPPDPGPPEFALPREFASPLGSAPPAPAPALAAPGVPGWGSALGDASGMPTGDLGGGQGGLGGLAGLASRIVDAMGGVLASVADQVGGQGPSEDALDEDDPFHPDDESRHKPGEADKPEPDEPEEAEPEADEAKDADPVAQAPPADASPPVAEPVPPVDPPPVDPPPVDPPAPATAPDVAPAPAGAPAPAPPADEGSTPCQIAADQLPKAGQ